MDMTGEYRIPAPRQIVWDALNDPETLKAAIVGCEELNRTGPNSFEAKVTAKVGPVKAKFGGKVTLEDLDPPNGYRIVGEGSGGAAGFAKGGAKVDLIDEGAETILRYEAKADVGGKLAQIGSRLVAGTAKKMADDFFGRFSQLVSQRAAASGAPAPAAPIASTTAPPAAAAVAAPVVETPTEHEPIARTYPSADQVSPRPAEPLAGTAAPEPATPPDLGTVPPRDFPSPAADAVTDPGAATGEGAVERPYVGGMPEPQPVAGTDPHGGGYEPGRVTTQPTTAPPGPVATASEPLEPVSVDDPARTSAHIQAAPEPAAVTPPPPVAPAAPPMPKAEPRPTTPSAPAKGGLPWTWIIVAIVVVLILLFLLG
ncbi:SRPBCC family protein [Geminicoccus harenae]|uniref:SRPBCC family protein n=1 Tax=Geminicoccus harenae TaxID=2498453 RepID=UPI001C970A9D|nr:carbon monoxide dehydrogenase subunit G [Geminicoccus harenae]